MIHAITVLQDVEIAEIFAKEVACFPCEIEDLIEVIVDVFFAPRGRGCRFLEVPRGGEDAPQREHCEFFGFIACANASEVSLHEVELSGESGVFEREDAAGVLFDECARIGVEIAHIAQG